MAKHRSLQERWDRQDGLDCLQYGLIIPATEHARVAGKLKAYAAIHDLGQITLAIDYLTANTKV